MDSFGFRLKNKNFILFSLFCFVLALYRLAKRKHLNGKWFILRAQNELMRFMNTHICRLMLSIIELMTEFASAPRLRARWWRLRSDNCPQERQQCFSRKYCPSGERVEAFHHDMRTGDNYANGISPARRRNVNSPFYLRQHNQRRCMVGVCQIDTKKQCDKSAIQIFNVFYFVCYNCHARVKINRFVVIGVCSDVAGVALFCLICIRHDVCSDRIEMKWTNEFVWREPIRPKGRRDVDSRYSITICERVFAAKCHLHRHEVDVYDLKLCRRGRSRSCRVHEIFETFKQVEQHRAHVAHYSACGIVHATLVPPTTTYSVLPRTHQTHSLL